MTRHTRQGCARGQRHGTLDREDPDVGYGDMWAATSHSGMAEQAKAAGKGGTAHVRPGDVISASRMACWCDGAICTPDPERPGHWTWPGRAEGAPHPRS